MKSITLPAVFTFTLLLLATGCSNDTAKPQRTTNSGSNNEFQVTAVNPYKFLFNDKEEGGAITFSSTELSQCDLTFIKNKFKSGYHARTDTFGAGDIDLSCLNDKANFSMSPLSPTYIELDVSEISNRQGSVKLSFSLYSARTREKLERKETYLLIIGEHLKQLGQ